MEYRRGSTGFWWENLGERKHVINVDVDGRMILKGISME
jgi:hypothetical protein